jgi:hypothetical protein
MKVTVTGVKRVQGTGKESGNPFDICRVFCLVPVENTAGKMTISGHGFEVAEMELEPGALAQFQGVKFPAELELQVDQKFMRGEFRSIVQGLAAGSAKVRVA